MIRIRPSFNLALDWVGIAAAAVIKLEKKVTIIRTLGPFTIDHAA